MVPLRHAVGAVVLALAAALTGCGDPTGPARRIATTLRIETGDAQTATIGFALTVTPVVVVLDQTGAPLAGVTVRFTVVEGGGSVQLASSVTDAQGRATPGAWTLGSSVGRNLLEASADGLPPVRFTATAASPYNIAVRFVGTATATQSVAVDLAIDRWRAIIIQDLTDIPMTAPAGECFAAQPSISERVDDLLIFIEFRSIDGVGDVLGQSGPCYIRTATGLPIVGYLQLDNADLSQIETQGVLNDLILHEIGHVLGFGTLWTDRNLVTGAGTEDPQYVGAAAVVAYRAAGGTAANVPVEETGGEGTRDSHWRESVFRTELMTGFLNPGTNPLSAVTVGSLQDLGYVTSAATASPFTLASGLRADAASAVGGMELHGREELRRPTHRIGPRGERTAIRH